MSDTGRVGFHAAYTDDNGQANVSSAGNAIVGAYLNQLGLPTSAIVYITDSPPNGIQWLSFADAQRVRIDVKLLNPSRPQDGSSKTGLAPSATSSNPPRKVSRSNAASSPTSDQPLYHLDKSGSAVVSLSNLYPDRNCSAQKTAGRIAKREFAKDGLTLSGVVIEELDGSREYVNVGVELDKADAVTKSWMMRGLHTLLAEGRSVDADIMACGASGRMKMLNAIR
jgi:hypothetical protein